LTEQEIDVLEQRPSEVQFSDGGDKQIWTMVSADEFRILLHMARRGARAATLTQETLKNAIYETLVVKDYSGAHGYGIDWTQIPKLLAVLTGVGEETT
jgi:hypothetical protein